MGFHKQCGVCVGAQNDEPLCPCRMAGVKKVNGRWVRISDLGPVKASKASEIMVIRPAARSDALTGIRVGSVLEPRSDIEWDPAVRSFIFHRKGPPRFAKVFRTGKFDLIEVAFNSKRSMKGEYRFSMWVPPSFFIRRGSF